MYEQKCKECGIVKPVSYFKAYAPGKYRRQCTSCLAEAQRGYQRKYDEKKKLLKTAKAVEKDLRQEVELLKAQVQSLLAFASLHGYNTTET
jgi:hypothetical protein